jgi:hypothetical protein
LRSRLFSSRSTASRMKPARDSFSSKTRSIRSSVPPGRRAGICSSLICFRPMPPTQLFLASQKARRAGNKAEAARLRAAYLEALKSNSFAAYWLESASASVAADYINGDFFTIKA